MVKELSHIFSSKAFDHAFGRYQGECSFEFTVESLLF